MLQFLVSWLLWGFAFTFTMRGCDCWFTLSALLTVGQWLAGISGLTSSSLPAGQKWKSSGGKYKKRVKKNSRGINGWENEQNANPCWKHAGLEPWILHCLAAGVKVSCSHPQSLILPFASIHAIQSPPLFSSAGKDLDVSSLKKTFLMDLCECNLQNSFNWEIAIFLSTFQHGDHGCYCSPLHPNSGVDRLPYVPGVSWQDHQ